METFLLAAKKGRAELQHTAALAATTEDLCVDGQDEDEEACHLHGIKGVYEGKTFTISIEPNTTRRFSVGRGKDCDISLHRDDEVSSKHARIDVKNVTFKITDTNSTNGTYVNVKKLGKRAHVLKEGDLITLGASTFKWVLGPKDKAPGENVTVLS